MQVKLELRVHPEVLHDLKHATDYFNSKGNGLGNRFNATAAKQIIALSTNAFLFTLKYGDVRCVKVKGFPYLIHYQIDEKARVVFVMAVICTYRNPDVSWKKRK